MNLMDTAQLLGNFGEFFGAIAVVATLAYLATQVRQSINATKTDARQRILDRYSDALGNVLAPNVLDSLRNGLNDWDGLSSKDQAAFSLAQSIFANNLFNAIRLRDEGTLDEETFAHISKGFLGGCRSPGGRTWWETARPSCPALLIDHVERELAAGVADEESFRVENIIPSDDSRKTETTS